MWQVAITVAFGPEMEGLCPRGWRTMANPNLFFPEAIMVDMSWSQAVAAS